MAGLDEGGDEMTSHLLGASSPAEKDMAPLVITRTDGYSDTLLVSMYQLQQVSGVKGVQCIG